MTKTIEFYWKMHYGRNDCYITDPKMKLAIFLISDKNVLTESMKKGLEMLGYTFKEVLPPTHPGII